MSPKATDVINFTQEILIFVLSWLVLTAAAIIISGKLMAKRVLLGFAEDDLFKINLYIFKIKAQGDEVSLGFITFMGNLLIFIIIGYTRVYQFVKDHAGLDIGPWNSLCASASFASIGMSFLLFIVLGLAKGAPILAGNNRAEMIDRVNALREIHDDH
jgi:hypothetical protein